MRSRIGTLLALVSAFVLALLAAPTAEAIAVAPATSLPACVYEGHHNTTVATYTTTERGPPAAYDLAPTYDAVDRWSHGASTCSGEAKTPVHCTYDDPARFARTAFASHGVVWATSVDEVSFTVVQRTSVAAEAGGDLTRVGRWMSPEEHGAMIDTGMFQEGGGGTTYVALPADPTAYGSEAASCSRYVEFNVPRSSQRPAGKEGWAQIPGPNSLYARLAQIRGVTSC